MSSLQISACWPHAKLGTISPLSPSCYPPPSRVLISATHVLKLPKTQLKLVYNASNCRKCTPVCLFGGKEKSENDNESSPWKDLKKAMGGLKKEPTVQDGLREKMQAWEFDNDDDGGGAGNRPGGGGDGSGDSEDEGLPGRSDGLLQAAIRVIIIMSSVIIQSERSRHAEEYFLQIREMRKKAKEGLVGTCNP